MTPAPAATATTAHLACLRESVVLRTMAGEVMRHWEAPAGCELPATTWTQAARECRAEAEARGLLTGVAAVTIDGDLDVHVVTDAAGVPLRAAFCGTDPRMEPDAGWLLAQLPGAAEDWLRITGAAPHAGRLVARCSWMHRSTPDLWVQVGRLCSLPEWVAGDLAQHRVAISTEMAAASGFWSTPDGSYTQLICAIIDADRSLESALGRVDAPADGVVGTWDGLDLRWA